LNMLNHPILDGYGLSEAGPNVALNGPNDWQLGTVGKPLPGTQIKLSNKGELLVKSPSITQGYWPVNSYNLSPIDENNWLATGDLAEITLEGYVKILGRLKNLLIVKGQNVLPEVIENVLRKHSEISEAVVVGVPQGTKGHRVHAFLEPIHDKLDIKSVQALLAECLEPAYHPRHYTVISTIPKLKSGKIDRQKLIGIAQNS
jgi:long-chain acyl-CoA synthetase